MKDVTKIVAIGNFCRALKTAFGAFLDAQDSFDDDRKTLKSIQSVGKMLSAVNEKSVRILARLMYGAEADMYTPEQILSDYEADYISEVKLPEIVRDYADDMFNMLCEVMNELDGSGEHSQLCHDVNDMVNAISREQSKYL